MDIYEESIGASNQDMRGMYSLSGNQSQDSIPNCELYHNPPNLEGCEGIDQDYEQAHNLQINIVISPENAMDCNNFLFSCKYLQF